MREIKNIRTIEEIIYESDDGLFKSENKDLVDEYEKQHLLSVNPDDCKIGELSELTVDTLSNTVFHYLPGYFLKTIYEAKNNEEFLSLIAALKKQYDAECFGYVVDII